MVLAGFTVWLPLAASVPFQPPLAVHDEALVLDHCSVDVLPTVIWALVGARLTVGAVVPVPDACTVTSTAAWPLP